MASGDTLGVFTPLHNQPPASSAATIDLRNQHPVLDFDAAADEVGIFGSLLPRNYAGGGITVRLHWSAATSTSGTVRWQGAFESHTQNVDDLDSNSFATSIATTNVPSSVAGQVQYSTLAFTDGAQIDGLAVGEGFRFQVIRTAGTTGASLTSNDTMTGDAELHRVEIRET